MKKNIFEWLDEYGEYHKNPTNKIIHWFCVPLIMISLFGLLSIYEVEFHIFNSEYNIKPYYALVLIAITFYLRLSLNITLGMIAASSLIMILVNYISIYDKATLSYFYVALFIFSWIIQFIGHEIEGKKPAFVKDLKFLLIGPAWLLSFIYKRLKIKI